MKRKKKPWYIISSDLGILVEEELKTKTLNGLNHGLESWEDPNHLHGDTTHLSFNLSDSYTLMQVS